jgi:hypothetical protein
VLLLNECLFISLSTQSGNFLVTPSYSQVCPEEECIRYGTEKRRKLRWTGHIAHTCQDTRNEYKMVIEKLHRKGQLTPSWGLLVWGCVVIWYDTNVLLHLEDGGSMELRKVGILPQHCTASQPKILGLDTSPWKSQNSRRTPFGACSGKTVIKWTWEQWNVKN